MKRLALPFLAAAAALADGAALAHPLPREASPAPNAVLPASPAELRITFSEGLIAPFSGLALKNAAGQSAPLGPATVDPRDKKQLSARVTARLPPGTYTVFWHAVGDDTHHVAGHYSFQVR